ncbi:hypothetical protein [Pseudoruegeria sp. HB172150]|uniref:hypothetical protein n=1 Tax=Pseudoruegeria sp. HB172150 TaxID=2721164 RepID=UPI001C12D8F7|nr:hypothetical protein [Pseudoruegeria sp. HB172150]
MKKSSLVLSAALIGMATAGFAGGKGHGKSAHAGKPGHGGNIVVQANCPPGLAKKNPPCVPPGLARTPAPDRRHDDGGYAEGYRDGLNDGSVVIYQPGDVIQRDYIVVENPTRFGLNPYDRYYRVGDRFYMVDEDTREVLAFVGALNDLLN